MDLIEKKTSLKFDFDIDSWNNLLGKAKNKQIDLLPILAKDKDREKYLLFTKNYLTVRDYVFSLQSTELKSDEDFIKKTVVIIKGYVHDTYFRENLNSYDERQSRTNKPSSKSRKQIMSHVTNQ